MRQEEQMNRLTQKLNNMESTMKDKENLIRKVNEENKRLDYKMEHLDTEREGNIEKIGTILNE